MIWKKNLFIRLLIFLISMMIVKNLYADNLWEKVNLPIEKRKLTFGVNNFVGLYDTNDGTDIRFNIFYQTNVLSKVENEHNIALAKDQNIDKELKIKLNEAFPSIWINSYADTIQKDKIASKTHESYRNKDKFGRGITNNKPSKRFELVLPFIGYSNFSDSLGLKDGVVVGARVSYNFAKRISVELEGGNTFSENNSGQSGKVIQALANLRFDISSFQLGQKWVTIYATGGVGKMFLRGFITNSDYNVLQLGAGATLDIKSWLGLRIDTRYFSIGEVNTSQNCIQSTAGLVFWF